MRKIELREYQIAATNSIIEFYYNDTGKGKMYISIGLGKSIIILSAIDRVLKQENKLSILLLSSTRLLCEQFKHFLLEEFEMINIANNIKEYTNHNIIVTTYQDLLTNYRSLNMSLLKLVVCDEANSMKAPTYDEIFSNRNICCIGVMSSFSGKDEGWFTDGKRIFEYTIYNAIKDGYIQRYDEQVLIESIVIPLLEKQGYTNILRGIPEKVSELERPEIEIIACREEHTLLVDVKGYRGIHISADIINNAVNQILNYKKHYTSITGETSLKSILVMFCEIDQNIKNKILEKFNLVIWDIGNLIYLCDNDQPLINILTQNLSYPISDVHAIIPLNHLIQTSDNYIETPITKNIYPNQLIKSLQECKCGKKDGNDKKYEEICTNIIKYLFDAEFSRISVQHKTDDEMFRMDLLCSVKGNSEFWEFLINFYHTKFIVFEYKNYKEYIPQNLVYVTEKYLFPVALRNVAFIISRKGFDKNAYKASIGCLRENGKLIISLSDKDLIKMIRKKESGQEPSDHLLEKVELLLMSVSK